MTFYNMCAQMGITENKLYNNEDNTQKEADDYDKSRIDAEEHVAEDNNCENAVNGKGNMEVFEEKGDEDSDDEVSKNASESDKENQDKLTNPNSMLYTSRSISIRRRQETS